MRNIPAAELRPPTEPDSSDMRERFARAPDFAAYLATVETNADLWNAVWERASIEADQIARAHEITGTWHLLALSEDWCGDAVNTLPVVGRLADAVPRFDLRVLARDDNLDLMDAHLTDGRSRSIPIVIVYDEEFRERGWWGPRPAPIQKWVMEEGLKLESGDRYKTVRRYYARDRGRTTVDELLAIIERVAESR